MSRGNVGLRIPHDQHIGRGIIYKKKRVHFGVWKMYLASTAINMAAY